jgi:hypothetical protein
MNPPPGGGSLGRMAPDDDSPEAFEDEPTHLDEMDPLSVSERQTRTYKSTEFLAGREAGFKDGVDAAVAALTGELVRAGCTEDEIKHIVARVRSGTTGPG